MLCATYCRYNCDSDRNGERNGSQIGVELPNFFDIFSELSLFQNYCIGKAEARAVLYLYSMSENINKIWIFQHQKNRST